MTKNQIEYFKMLETQRANRAQEQLTKDRDSWNKELGFANLGETRRSHLENERQARAVLGEQTRHNIETERFNQASLDETSRSNRARENYQLAALEETKRSNLAQEDLKGRSLDLQGQQLQLSLQDLNERIRHNVVSESETQRSNLAREDETRRSNIAREEETKRFNLSTEKYRSQSIALDQAKMEQNRYLTEKQISLGYSQLAETRRANVAAESERHRSNVASEQLTKTRDTINAMYNKQHLAETKRANRESESLRRRQQEEMERRNQSVESISRFQASTGAVNNAFRTLIPLMLY